MKLKNNKSHGRGGIPGGTYELLTTWLAKPLRTTINKIHHGDELPLDCANGTIVHIYRQKGDIRERRNYRPICLAQIAYKIWSFLHTGKLIRILHLATSTARYGYKQGISTTDSIRKIDQYIKEGAKEPQIPLMHLSKAFDGLNRTHLGNSIKKDYRWKHRTNQARRSKNTTMCKISRAIWADSKNNVVAFRGSAISALMFILYLDDMVEGYGNLNQMEKLPTRKTARRDRTAGNNDLPTHISQRQKHDAPGNVQIYLTKLACQHGQTTTQHFIRQQDPPGDEKYKTSRTNNKKTPTNTTKKRKTMERSTHQARQKQAL